mmetsp:Transcript_4029/g.11450  ORF Transcript_4029/g.11450 Transcript_4029/m.11450 type:complete len:300 (-) Transcript_4029:871-1770(-)
MHLGQFPLPLRQQRLRFPVTHRRISRLRRADAVAPHDARDQFRLGLLAVGLPLLDALRQLSLGVPRAPHRVVGPLVRVGGPSFQALGGGVVRRLDVLQGRVRAVRVRLEPRQVPPMSLGDGQRLRVPLVAVPDLLVPPPQVLLQPSRLHVHRLSTSLLERLRVLDALRPQALELAQRLVALRLGFIASQQRVLGLLLRVPAALRDALLALRVRRQLFFHAAHDAQHARVVSPYLLESAFRSPSLLRFEVTSLGLCSQGRLEFPRPRAGRLDALPELVAVGLEPIRQIRARARLLVELLS